jgi:DNA-directed RNA polymerase specialized sigma subunit
MELSKEAREAKNAYQREWRHKNRNKANAYLKKWRKMNPDKIRKYQQDYWERKAAKSESFETRILDLHKRGLSLRQIATEVGINHMKVSRILKKL